jgi:hypothetical protein
MAFLGAGRVIWHRMDLRIARRTAIVQCIMGLERAGIKRARGRASPIPWPTPAGPVG